MHSFPMQFGKPPATVNIVNNPQFHLYLKSSFRELLSLKSIA